MAKRTIVFCRGCRYFEEHKVDPINDQCDHINNSSLNHRSPTEYKRGLCCVVNKNNDCELKEMRTTT